MARRGDGLVLRGKTWWLDFTNQGQRYQVRLGRNISKTVARELATVERGKALKQEAGIGRKRKDIAFDKATEEFIKWAEANKRPKTVKSYKECIKQLKRSFGGMELSKLHSFLLEKHKQMRIGEGAKVAVNRELTCIKTLINRCVDWKLFEGDNPARKVKKLEESKGKIRFLDIYEEAALLREASEPLRTIILSGIHAGLRIKAEALTLKKEMVNFSQRILTVEAGYAKNKETRSIPLNSTLFDALRSIIPQQSGEYVFAKNDGQPFKSIRTIFTTACRRAKLVGVTLHTLRHTFASRLVMAGVDLRTVQELGGWKDLKMVMRYAHLSPAHKAEAIEKIANYSTTLFTTSKVAHLVNH